MFAIRVPISVLAGVALSVALFLGLWQLVSVPFTAEALIEARIIEFTRQIVDTPPENRRDPQVTRKPPLVPPGPPTIRTTGRDDVVVEYTGTRIDPIIERRDGLTRGIDGDATPIVRMEPDYPPRAATNNIEGWVQVRFSVTSAGTVRDAVVVASEPGTTFDDAALKAVARWRYNPRVVDGVAVERVGLETVFRFELE